MRENLFEYMAYLETKVEQKRAERREKAFEEIERREKERQKEKEELNNLFEKAGATSIFKK